MHRLIRDLAACPELICRTCHLEEYPKVRSEGKQLISTGHYNERKFHIDKAIQMCPLEALSIVQLQ